jgi:hypothetical protein
MHQQTEYLAQTVRDVGRAAARVKDGVAHV